ncbi:hypothetical protein ADU37_CDS11600 [Thermococcus sp. 2319x1]|nr:hypothetical protein ADU37_CDS11600 [Thermococcus sp. 2319x1]
MCVVDEVAFSIGLEDLREYLNQEISRSSEAKIVTVPFFRAVILEDFSQRTHFFEYENLSCS